MKFELAALVIALLSVPVGFGDAVELWLLMATAALVLVVVGLAL